MPRSLTIVLPAYNEEESLGVFLPELIRFCELHGFELIITNDGSTDDTAVVLSSFSSPRMRVISHKLNRGYGAAIKSGIRAATTEFVVTLDADGQHDPEDILKLKAFMEESQADMVVGNRGGSGSSVYRNFGKGLIRFIARLLLPVPVKDLNSGIKIYETALAKRYLGLCPDGMAYSDIITLVFISQRHLVKEIPVTIRPRKAGQSTISTRTAIQTVLEIINIVMLFSPLKVFGPLSLLCLVVGMAWELPFLFAGEGVSAGALLAFITGVLLFLLGLLAEQLSIMRRDGLG